MDIKPNRFGKYRKEDILKTDYPILDYGDTYSDLQRIYDITLTEEERITYIIGFKTGKGYRGYVPVYNGFEIIQNRP